MINKTLFMILLLIVFTNTAYTDYNGPASDDVRRELKNLLKDKSIEDKFIKPDDSKPMRLPFIDLGFLNYIIIMVVIIIFAILLYYLIMQIYKRYAKDIRSQDNMPDQDLDNNKLTTLEEFYQKSVELAQQGHFAFAVILLHRASVEYLRKKMLISANLQYTNNDLKRLVYQGMNRIYAPFCRICTFAELAAFKGIPLSNEIYSDLQLTFQKDFLEK